MQQQGAAGILISGDDARASCANVSKAKVPSYSRASWCRLREVCCVLQETQQRVIKQKDELDALLHMDAEYRDTVSAVQAQTIVLRSLESSVERAKCRLMTIRMKLICVHDEKRLKEAEHEERIEEIARMEEDVRRRTETVSAMRETISYTASQLVLRQRRMLNDLMDIYVIDVRGLPENRLSPLPCVCLPAVTIAGLHLPDAITSLGHAETEMTSALGHVVHMLNLIAQILNVPLRFPMSFLASRSTIVNPLTAEIFPLYSSSKNRDKFEEALQYLNRNIGQLRFDCGLTTRNIGTTLANLHDLLVHLTIADSGAVVPGESLISRPFAVTTVKSAESVFLSMTQRAKCESESKTVILKRVDIPIKYSRPPSIGSQNSVLFDSSAIAALSLANASEGTVRDDKSDDVNGSLVC
uniref:UV radiation resistance-associated gene protein n=2 Tax=Parascaris univalens TaxID=6257 RepID=A0A915B8W9_PARUN